MDLSVPPPDLRDVQGDKRRLAFPKTADVGLAGRIVEAGLGQEWKMGGLAAHSGALSESISAFGCPETQNLSLSATLSMFAQQALEWAPCRWR